MIKYLNQIFVVDEDFDSTVKSLVYLFFAIRSIGLLDFMQFEL